jgi:hypothetical protein
MVEGAVTQDGTRKDAITNTETPATAGRRCATWKRSIHPKNVAE